MMMVIYVANNKHKINLGRISLHVSANNIPTLYRSYSDHFNLKTVGVDLAHSKQ